MIRIEPISPTEAWRLKEVGIASFWGLPLGMTFVFLALRWLLNRPWNDFFWLSGGIWSICIILWLLWYKPPVFTEKIIRRGKIIHSAYLDNNPIAKLNIGQHIDITLEEEPIPAPYKARHNFTIWRSTGTTFFKQEFCLRHRYKELVGKEVELEYIAESGKVISFRLLANLKPEKK